MQTALSIQLKESMHVQREIPSACIALCTKRSSIFEEKRKKRNHPLIIIFKDVTSAKDKTSEIEFLPKMPHVYSGCVFRC